jgi:hypothetical protein
VGGLKPAPTGALTCGRRKRRLLRHVRGEGGFNMVQLQITITEKPENEEGIIEIKVDFLELTGVVVTERELELMDLYVRVIKSLNERISLKNKFEREKENWIKRIVNKLKSC